MSALLYVVIIISMTLLALLLWSLRQGAGTRQASSPMQDPVRSCLQYFPQIHQALTNEDRQFLLTNGGAKLARRVDSERRGLALQFLTALEEEFANLMRMSRVVASLSPDVETVQEFERLLLQMVFHYRLLSIRTRLKFGLRPLPELNVVSDLVSRLSVRMEAAMRELGERAARAAEVASAPDRKDVDFA